MLIKVSLPLGLTITVPGFPCMSHIVIWSTHAHSPLLQSNIPSHILSWPHQHPLRQPITIHLHRDNSTYRNKHVYKTSIDIGDWGGSWAVLMLLQQFIYWFSDDLLTICILQAQEIQGRWLDNYLNALTLSLCLNQVRPIAFSWSVMKGMLRQNGIILLI